MTDYIFKGIALLALILVGCQFFLGSPTFGANATSTITNLQKFTQGIQVGTTTSLSTVNSIIARSCNLIGSNASQLGSSTLAYDCTVTGLTPQYNVMAMLATSTPGPDLGDWSIVGAKASSTAGYATVLLKNGGASRIPSVTSVGSSTVIWAFK